MKKYTLKISLFLLVFSLLGGMTKAENYYVDFESFTKTSYASATVTLGNYNWNFTGSVAGNSTSDWKVGSVSARLAGTTKSTSNAETTKIEMLSNKAGGIGNISFQYRKYGSDEQIPWYVQWSSDGTTWTTIQEITATDVVQTFSFDLNQDNARIRIIANGFVTSTANGKRINIDELYLTDNGSQTSVANPTFTVTGTIKSTDVYWNSAKVSISSSTAGASIYYTLDGSEPTTSSTLYEGEITITTTTTIKAIAVKSGMNNSQISEKTITISAPATASLPFTEIFDGNLGDFYPFSKTGDQIWIASSYSSGTYTKFAKMSGYSGGNKENEDWLISPEFTPASVSGITLTFASATNYNGPALQLKYSTNYDGFSDPSTATWTDITGSAAWPAEASSFAWVESGNVSIAGATPVRFAFVYTSTTEAAATWEVANVNVVNSAASATPTITVTEISVPEMSANVGKTDTETITVSGANLTDNIILTISGANADQFSVSPSSIEPVSGTVTDASVTITYLPTVEGNHVAVLTLSSTGAEDVSLNLSGSATVSGLNLAVIKGVYARDGKIFVNAAVAGMNIEVYNTVGQRVASQVLKGDLNIIPVSTKGVLLVKCGSEVTKVILP